VLDKLYLFPAPQTTKRVRTVLPQVVEILEAEMSKRKMCKYRDPKTGGCMRRGIYNCPKNVNERTCEIVKLKEKWVKVKAYGWIGAGSGRLLTDTEKLPNRFPCYILAKKKDLEER